MTNGTGWEAEVVGWWSTNNLDGALFFTIAPTADRFAWGRGEGQATKA